MQNNQTTPTEQHDDDIFEAVTTLFNIAKTETSTIGQKQIITNPTIRKDTAERILKKSKQRHPHIRDSTWSTAAHMLALR